MVFAIDGIFVVLFVILGLVFRSGRGAFLIAGYNTASEKEKAETDERKLCKYMGRLMFLLAGCQLVMMSSQVFGKLWLLWLGLALFFLTAIGGVVFLNTGDRLKK